MAVRVLVDHFEGGRAEALAVADCRKEARPASLAYEDSPGSRGVVLEAAELRR